MVVIIVSAVIIVTERVIFQKKSARFFVFDGCDHCDYCHKRDHFSLKLYNVFYL